MFDQPIAFWRENRALILSSLVVLLVISFVSGFIAYSVADSNSADRAEKDKETQAALRQATATIRAQQAKVAEVTLTACEDRKKDRVDDARGWTRVEQIISKNANNPSFNDAARKNYQDAISVIHESANSLRTRLFLCPLYVKGIERIDQVALAEAKGKL